MSGWWSAERGITSHPLFEGNALRLAVWVWLLDNAAWKETRHDVGGKTITVPRGSVCASTRHIAARLGVGHQVVRSALDRFKREHMINTDATQGKTVVSICKYDEYQSPGRTPNTGGNTAATQQQHSANTQKKQGNKETREANASLDARTAEILASASSLSQAQDFVAHRREMKKPMTERAARAMADKLAGHPDPDAVLRDSIANGWQGIFPEKTQSKGQTSGAETARRVAESVRAMDSGEGADPSQPLLPPEPASGRSGSSFERLGARVIRFQSGAD